MAFAVYRYAGIYFFFDENERIHYRTYVYTNNKHWVANPEK